MIETLPSWIRSDVSINPYSRQCVCAALSHRDWLTNPVVNACAASQVVFADGSEHDICRINRTDDGIELIYEIDGGVGVLKAKDVLADPDVILE